jgi:hypothetical protein
MAIEALIHRSDHPPLIHQEMAWKKPLRAPPEGRFDIFWTAGARGFSYGIHML